MKTIKIICIVLLLASCQSVKKATAYLEKKDALPEICAGKFPVKETFLPGDTIVSYDTVWNNTEMLWDTETHDTLIRDTLVKYKVLDRVITKTKVVTDTIVKENTARVRALQVERDKREKIIGQQLSQIEELRADLDAMENKRDWWRKVCLITWLICSAYIGLKIKKVIPF